MAISVGESGKVLLRYTNKDYYTLSQCSIIMSDMEHYQAYIGTDYTFSITLDPNDVVFEDINYTDAVLAYELS